MGQIANGWERESTIRARKQLLDISSVSRIFAEYSTHEAAWKLALHHPLLNLASNDADNIRRYEENLRLGRELAIQRGQDVRLRVENVTSANYHHCWSGTPVEV